MVSLKNIITHILQAHGFEVYERDSVLYGQREGDIVSVGLFDNVTVADLRKHAKAVSQEASRHIVCTLSPGSLAEQEAIKLELTLWRKADIEAEIGLAMQSRIENIPGAMLGQLVEAPPKDNESASVTIESLGTEGQPVILKSKLTLDDIKELSRSTVDGFKHDLELVPHYLFQYSCTYEGKDGQPQTRKGLVSVNGLTGRYSAWNAEPEAETGISHQVQLEPKIDSENALKIAVHAVAQLNTEFKEIITERDHATIIEKAMFRPGPETIKIEAQRMVMVPVWCVEGRHGVMILDGITGKVISEDYYEKR